MATCNKKACFLKRDVICKPALSALCVSLHLSLMLPYITVLKILAYLELTSLIEADNLLEFRLPVSSGA